MLGGRLLGKRMGEQIIYLCQVESLQTMRYSGHVGDFKPMHSTASGKALLASMLAPERLSLISRLTLSRQTPATITQQKQLLQDIDKGAKAGWWYRWAKTPATSWPSPARSPLAKRFAPSPLPGRPSG